VPAFSREAALPLVYPAWTGDLTTEITDHILSFQNIIYAAKFFAYRFGIPDE